MLFVQSPAFKNAGLWTLMAMHCGRLLLFVRVALSVAFCERSLFLLSPYVESPQLLVRR